MISWMNPKLESRFPGELPTTSYADDTILKAESEEELKSLLMRVKEESEKAGLNSTLKNNDLGIGSHHFMANREKVQTVTNFIFLGSRITADNNSSHKIKRCLLLGRKTMTNLGVYYNAETSLCHQRSV